MHPAPSLTPRQPAAWLAFATMLRRIWDACHCRLALVCLLAVTALFAVTGCGQFFPRPTTGGTSGGSGGGSGGSGSGNTNPGSVYFAYSNPSLDSIAAFSLSASGQLGNLPNSPTGLGVIPSTLAISPTTNLLYAGSELGGVYGFIINSDGSLTVANGNAPVASDAASSMVVDPTGQWLLVMSNLGSPTGGGTTPQVTIYQINLTNGLVTSTGTLPLDNGSAAQLQFAPNGTQLYASLGTGGIDALTFNPVTGSLLRLAALTLPSRNGYADQGLAVDPQGRYLFAAETGTNGVRVFTINADSSLTEAAGSPYPTGLGAHAVQLDRTGAYVYVANSAAANISAFSLAGTGSLTPLAGSPFATGTSPFSLAADRTGNSLIVACTGGSPDVQVFSIAAGTGVLSSASTAVSGNGAPAGASAVVASP